MAVCPPPSTFQPDFGVPKCFANTDSQGLGLCRENTRLVAMLHWAKPSHPAASAALQACSEGEVGTLEKGLSPDNSDSLCSPGPNTSHSSRGRPGCRKRGQIFIRSSVQTFHLNSPWSSAFCYPPFCFSSIPSSSQRKLGSRALLGRDPAARYSASYPWEESIPCISSKWRGRGLENYVPPRGSLGVLAPAAQCWHWQADEGQNGQALEFQSLSKGLKQKRGFVPGSWL